MEDLLVNPDAQTWQRWIIPLTGLASAILTLFLGRMVLQARWRKPATPPEEAAGEGSYVAGSSQERRQAIRRHGTPVKILVTGRKAQARPEEGWVLNRSLSGLGLCLSEAQKQNAILNIRAVDAPENMPGIDVQVVHCQKKEQGWEVGCTFVQRPPWSVLLMFG